MDELSADIDVLTAKEREALLIAAEPWSARRAILQALGISSQALHNRAARARRKLAQARAARLRASL